MNIGTSEVYTEETYLLSFDLSRGWFLPLTPPFSFCNRQSQFQSTRAKKKIVVVKNKTNTTKLIVAIYLLAGHEFIKIYCQVSPLKNKVDSMLSIRLLSSTRVVIQVCYQILWGSVNLRTADFKIFSCQLNAFFSVYISIFEKKFRLSMKMKCTDNYILL